MEELPPQIPTPNMQLIKGGNFDMGDVLGDYLYKDELPIHAVKVADFYLSAYCVTFEEYDAFCAATNKQKPDDHGGGRGNMPVVNVSWYDAVEFCNELSLQQGLTPAYTIHKNHKDPNNESKYDELKWLITTNPQANGYRLPTEAEWEFAAREGGKMVRFGTGQNILRPTEANFDARANHKNPYSEVGEYRGKTVPVNSFCPNALGLYNMSGNVWEWCWDWYGRASYNKNPQQNYPIPEKGVKRVVRGGCFINLWRHCRVAMRFKDFPNARNHYVGFRVCRSIG